MLVERPWDPRVWPSRLIARYLFVVCVFAFVVGNYVIWHDVDAWDAHDLELPKSLSTGPGPRHPITKLMREAKTRHEAQLAKRSLDVAAAADRYRTARGRHPPPGFDKWFQAALDSDSIVVEEYFDRIYKDLTPFWALDVDTISRRANSWYWVVKVRNGTAVGEGDNEGMVPWLQLWTALVDEFAEHLPDVDMPINYMDEPRLLVPYDKMAKLVAQENKERSMPAAATVTSKFKGLQDIDAATMKPYNPKWAGPDDKSYWDLAVKTCGPSTPAYKVRQISKSAFPKPAEFPKNWQPEYAYSGFVQNWTAAMDPCLQPHLRQLHGSFIEPLSLRSSEELIPMFGGSKLPMNNEILIPGAMYLTDNEMYSGGNILGPKWKRKKNGLVWRGDATGGRARPKTWHHFQRHRLIDMLNATTVQNMEETGERAKTFELPPRTVYPSKHRERSELNKWLGSFADAGFVNLCAPGECDFAYDFFSEIDAKPMKEQYEYKFLPDVDGNSFSARFRGFMRSTSTPLKATIYAEWHDDRLIPWLHFVPLDNTFQDLYPVLEYFDDRQGPGDDSARWIAEHGSAWAKAALRREDMRLYLWRLLLEWARVCDENRADLGYVDDLRE